MFVCIYVCLCVCVWVYFDGFVEEREKLRKLRSKITMRVNQRLSSPFAEESEVEDDYSKDGSVDLKGNPVRSLTQRPLRTAYYGISSNLITYLTDKLHQGTLQASNNVTNWTATVWITPIFGAYLADAHLGRYRTFIVASFVCLIVSSMIILQPSFTIFIISFIRFKLFLLY
ncbi:hypothetical protein IC582_012556 [Cucumis melo]